MTPARKALIAIVIIIIALTIRIQSKREGFWNGMPWQTQYTGENPTE